jgi:hypothetical protein
MQRWIVPALAAFLLAAFPLLLVAASRGLHGTDPAPAKLRPPVEVGETYGFGVSGADLIGKVLDEPCGDWLKVEIRDGDKPRVVWLNIHQVSYLEPDPPADKGGGCCPKPTQVPAL